MRTRCVVKITMSTLLASIVALWAAYATADTTLELKNDFIETFKDRATIDAAYLVKFSHPKPKTPSPSKPSNDGDIHISGTAPEIGLLTVAEIMNAKDFPSVLTFVHDRQGSNVAIAMTGVWRIWRRNMAESRTTSRAKPTPMTSRTQTQTTSSRFIR